MSEASAAGQLSKSAAEIYDEFFVPALFGEWAGPLCDAAMIAPGNTVLDVACGTGATTREAARRIAPNGRVTGLDRNAGMISVAQSRISDIEWIEAQAEDLPFAAKSFDVVLAQFGLMFFDDRAEALGEMRRVTRPGGRVALTVWDDVANSPGYAAMIDIIEDMFGSDAANALRMPFVLGDPTTLKGVLTAGGLLDAKVTTVTGTARFASLREWVRMDVRGWTLAEFIDDAGFETLVKSAERRLGHLAARDGTITFSAPAHIAVWKNDPASQ